MTRQLVADHQKELRGVEFNHALAIRALQKGEATAGQQKLALFAILTRICGVGSNPLGETVEETHVNIGKALVGREIKMLYEGDIDIMFPELKEEQGR